jgi:hypothetical protein
MTDKATDTFLYDSALYTGFCPTPPPLHDRVVRPAAPAPHDLLNAPTLIM